MSTGPALKCRSDFFYMRCSAREIHGHLNPTATLVEHTLLTQGFMGTSTVSFSHHW